MHVYMYQEHYYPGLDDAQREENRLHSGKSPLGMKRLLAIHQPARPFYLQSHGAERLMLS